MKASATFLLAAVLTASAQQAPKINRIPPPGVEVPAADRTELEAGLKQLAAEIAKLKANPKFAAELPNVEIFHKSADWALRYNEIFDAKQIPIAKEHVQQGLARAAALAKGEIPWDTASGLVVRGYRSKIDGSVQPYGLLVPEGMKAGAKVPLHFWCHGRGEKLSELAFIDGSQKNKGEFTPEGAIVCFLYGRYCNANKFAGEVDLFEALDDVKKHYSIDEQRLVIRGFSMGGAAAWQFATHHSGMWAAAAPGAGFSETAEFFRSFAEGKEAPPWWEQVLWRWYDSTTMAANLSNTSTVAYSGEIDGQKQAADIMVKYAAQEGITFPHIIGPQTPHKYHKDSIPEINKLVDAAVEEGNPIIPEKIHFTTYTLIYPQAELFKIQGMEREWERADISGEQTESGVRITTKNVSAFDYYIPSVMGHNSAKQVVEIDGQKIQITMPKAVSIEASSKALAPENGYLVLAITREAGNWTSKFDKSNRLPINGVKNPTVCGPIDHAFMSRFVFVRPTGKPLNDTVGAWAKAEMEHAIVQWRQVFRGEVQVVDDTAVTDALAKDANLVAWGDISSNKYLAKLVAKLPLRWDATTLTLGTQKVDAAHHAPILIYPNPLNPARYIVLNSGFTFREAAATNNSDQTPKLPDWAVVDLRTPPGPKWPGQIVDAGFFDENWK